MNVRAAYLGAPQKKKKAPNLGAFLEFQIIIGMQFWINKTASRGRNTKETPVVSPSS